jgi:hypothetical protein
MRSGCLRVCKCSVCYGWCLCVSVSVSVSVTGLQLEARILGLREDVAEANTKLRKRLSALEHTVDSKPVKE